ncbi:hypothetical protein [Maribellus sp. YY47]|uniref:hypothetical protein n=1 Tax=Maribellus sp. YY47 TaxID=2929486 RepID=UPI002000C463|nr:hypothetical protein [Maribellus sp. YY47]MCK3685780.1 hypothetical protein [Maribellus sp. YY47]
MKQNTLLSRFTSWLVSPAVFGSISKNFPGEWRLYEYYVDEKEGLLHFLPEDLKCENQMMQLIFSEDNFVVKAQLPVSLIQNLKSGAWSVAKNFITFVDSANFRNNIEFQFAFEKGNLKLLKKDERGMIEFFGFFKPIDGSQQSIKNS